MAISLRQASIAACLALAGTASADPEPGAVAAPGDESGRTGGEEEGSTGTDVARGALWVPKILAEVLSLPFRGSVWLYDRYELNDLYYRTFYNNARTFGIVPTIAYSTGLGLTVGAELVHKDLFGEHEHLSIAGTWGGSYHTRNSAWIDSGKRFDPVLLRLGGNFDRFDPLPFYGIGNQDLSSRPAMPVDAQAMDTAFHTSYRYQELRGEVSADWRVIDELHLIGRANYTELKSTKPSSGTSVEAVFDPASVVGFEQTFRHLYGELEVRWDRRHIARLPWETTKYTTGWLVRGLAGRVHELDAGADFTHYAADLQGFVHLGLGPRMLVFRLWGEGVTGSLSTVPFTELPYLGGDFLRGYDFARFRDRVTGLGTAEYVWDLSRFADAYVFADAGRVFSSVDAVTLNGLRVGYGVGVTIHDPTNFLIGGTIASSIDGGIFFTLTLSPLWDATPRWR